MANLLSALDRANGMLRLGGLPFRIRERRHSPWLSVYEVLPGAGTKERAMRGYSSADPGAAEERLYEKVVEVAKKGPPLTGQD
jgi:hypothetical protein